MRHSIRAAAPAAAIAALLAGCQKPAEPAASLYFANDRPVDAPDDNGLPRRRGRTTT